jgi:hypothetical protein
MVKKLSYLSFVTVIVAIIWGCNKSSELTSFLDETTEVPIMYHEIDFTAKTIYGDSSLTFNDSSFIPSHFAGQIDDPYFGLSRATLNFQVGIITEPDLSESRLDSVVLSLAYDTTLQLYGQPNASISYEVYELDDDYSRRNNYYSSQEVKVKPTPIGEVNNLQPNFKDTVLVIEPQSIRRDTVSYLPHLRIRIDAIGEELLALTQQDFASVAIFLEKFKGLSLRPKSTCEGMVYFNMSTALTRMNLYYTQRDTARLMQFPLLPNSLVYFNTHENDLQSSPAEDVITNGSDNDSLLFLASMEGPDILLEVGDLDSLQGTTINYAELSFNLAVLSSDDTLVYHPIEQLIIQELHDDGSREDIIDLQRVGGNDIPDFFGGDFTLDSDKQMAGYRFTITEHLQDILAGSATKKMIISNIYKGAQPSRSILYGKSSNPLTAKIKVTHSITN